MDDAELCAIADARRRRLCKLVEESSELALGFMVDPEASQIKEDLTNASLGHFTGGAFAAENLLQGAELPLEWNNLSHAHRSSIERKTGDIFSSVITPVSLLQTILLLRTTGGSAGLWWA